MTWRCVFSVISPDRRAGNSLPAPHPRPGGRPKPTASVASSPREAGASRPADSARRRSWPGVQHHHHASLMNSAATPCQAVSNPGSNLDGTCGLGVERSAPLAWGHRWSVALPHRADWDSDQRAGAGALPHPLSPATAADAVRVAATGRQPAHGRARGDSGPRGAAPSSRFRAASLSWQLGRGRCRPQGLGSPYCGPGLTPQPRSRAGSRRRVLMGLALTALGRLTDRGHSGRPSCKGHAVP
jgi:hypothetical protein